MEHILEWNFFNKKDKEEKVNIKDTEIAKKILNYLKNNIDDIKIYATSSEGVFHFINNKNKNEYRVNVVGSFDKNLIYINVKNKNGKNLEHLELVNVEKSVCDGLKDIYFIALNKENDNENKIKNIGLDDF
jgi:hypothetical protein